MRRAWRAIAGTFWTWRAMRRGWMIDGDLWFYRPTRYNDRPAGDFACSAHAFIAGGEEVADGWGDPRRQYLFCRSGRQAIELDTGGMV